MTMVVVEGCSVVSARHTRSVRMVSALQAHGVEMVSVIRIRERIA